ncbi:hypothetical protein PTKIN_Ptkin14bG0071700 [Pterospermum kingtungense]
MEPFNLASSVQVIPQAETLEFGNLVVRDGDENILWQSFDYPSDTLLQKLKLGKDSITDNCDHYALCGANSRCNVQCSNLRKCLEGFVPKFPRDWNALEWTGGCVRRTNLNRSQDGFLKHTGVKLPDTSSSWFNGTMSLEMCKEKCLKNCSCSAYANSDIRGGGSGCLLWSTDLMDIREFGEDGHDLYIRMAASELVSLKDSKNSSKNKKVEIIVILVILTGLIFGRISFLLEVEETPKARPSLAAVVVMFGSDSSLPQPKQPGFYTERDPLDIESSPYSVNEITSMFIEAR